MTQQETGIQRRIVRELRRAGCYAVRQRLHGRRGWPDIYAILPCCHPCHLEVKTVTGRVAPLQSLTLAELMHAGAVTGIVHNEAEALELICDHMERCPGAGRTWRLPHHG